MDRKLANAGHFPAIDVLSSISRVAGAVTTDEQKSVMRTARRLLDARRDVKELVEIGAYVHGTNPDADRALALWPGLEAFLQQDMRDLWPAEDSWSVLKAALQIEDPQLEDPQLEDPQLEEPSLEGTAGGEDVA